MTAHVLGGSTCREYLGRASEMCGQPGINGLCPEHATERAAWEQRMASHTKEES